MAYIPPTLGPDCVRQKPAFNITEQAQTDVERTKPDNLHSRYFFHKRDHLRARCSMSWATKNDPEKFARIQVYSKTLDAQLGAAPVPALIVVPVFTGDQLTVILRGSDQIEAVPDFIVCAHPNPLRNLSVLLGLLGKSPLRSKSLVGCLQINDLSSAPYQRIFGKIQAGKCGSYELSI
jgi:hypothetical protein